MIHPKDLKISDYSYDLPKEKIAFAPLPKRDDSKLLVWNNGKIHDSYYRNIGGEFLPGSLLIFNDTRVIPARISFTKDTGSIIEIFLLEPFGVTDYQHALSQKNEALWKCMVGGLAKWKGVALKKDVSINGLKIELSASIFRHEDEGIIIKFIWPGSYTLSEILDYSGSVPLPPYIKRKPSEEDKVRYQTLYAKSEGSVAAPTAGLHFSETIFQELKANNIEIDYVTLHVGAGTFRPVKSERMNDHPMHEEVIDIHIDLIEKLIQINEVVAVGTTSMRTLESLYWMGVKSYYNTEIDIDNLPIKQWEVYDQPLVSLDLSKSEALLSLTKWMRIKQIDRLVLSTQILIAPGYLFRIVKQLVTNFHQPNSTLLLLVAAAIGDDWKKLYSHALNNNYRFLSYGDGCLIKIKNMAI